MRRRNFIKTVSLLGASITVASPVSAKAFLSQTDDGETKNDYFTVSFDKGKGTINIYRTNGTPLITGGTACVNLPSRPADSNISKRFITSGIYKHRLDSTVFMDQLGSGKRLIIFSRDPAKKLDFEIQLSLYDQLEAITIETICKNISDHDLVINSLEPIRVIKDEGGILSFPGVSKCITNGEMYYDTGTIHEFGNNDNAISSGELKGVKLVNGSISAQNETVNSWWNAGLFSGYDNEGMVLGYLE
ncbi:MAG: hypothetical protein ACRDE8_10320, partial [Ginsengibacter sp.]